MTLQVHAGKKLKDRVHYGSFNDTNFAFADFCCTDSISLIFVKIISTVSALMQIFVTSIWCYNSKIFYTHGCSDDEAETQFITTHCYKSSDGITLNKMLELLCRLAVPWPKQSNKFRQCILAFQLAKSTRT